jgi:hypothetical protein
MEHATAGINQMKKNMKPLLLESARQMEKTYLLKDFGK